MELWDVYDKDRAKTGRTMVRGEAFEEGDSHLVVQICLINSNGEMLIQQRQSFKDGWPNMWDLTAGGSAVAGDTSQTAAQRELFEEVGIVWEFSGVRPYFTMNYPRGFTDFYIIEADVDIEKLKLQYEEVQAVKWAAKEEIMRLIDEGTFMPYYKDVISLVFAMKGKHLGGLSVWEAG